MVDEDEINRLVDLMEARGLIEVEVEGDGRRLRVVRAAGSPAPAAAAGERPVPAAAGHPVCAPMTGTFYRAPAPDAEPYVELGSEVAAGDVLCIIESMKMMNPVEADRSGVISDIRIGNGEPVDAGQVLFVIS